MFFNRQSIFALPLAVGVAAVVSACAHLVADARRERQGRQPGRLADSPRLLFSEYVFPFELVSLVLLAAMIGAIVLAAREDESR